MSTIVSARKRQNRILDKGVESCYTEGILRRTNEKVPFSLVPPADFIAPANFSSHKCSETHMGEKISYHSLLYE